MKTTLKLILAATGLLALASCGSQPPADPGPPPASYVAPPTK